MKISVDHRPWSLPSEPWMMRQTWRDLLFIHWPVPANSLQKFIPESLQLETFNGNAWIGIVPFRMTDVGLRGLPGVSFNELNVRTYVTDGNKSGVWFFSLDAESLLAVRLARWWYRLPYFHANMSLIYKNGSYLYQNKRKNGELEEFAASYKPTSEIIKILPQSLEYWLTERYCLYSTDKKNLYRAEIHHNPWQLQQASLSLKTNTMMQSLKVELLSDKPLLHFSKKQEVILWNIKKVSRL